MAVKNVVLVGAGGNLGPAILNALLEGGLNVTVLARASSKSTLPSDVKVVQVADDYPRAELVAAFKGQDAVISTISSLAIAAQKAMIDAVVEAGVPRFVPSEWGSPAPPGEENNLPFAGKAEIRDYLRTKESQGLVWTGICNNDFFEWGLEVGFFRIDFAKHQATRLDSGDSVFPLSTWKTIGAALLGVLRLPEETKNRLVYVATVHASQNDLIAAAERAVGAKFQVETLDRSTFLSEQEAMIKQGNVMGIYGKLWAITTGGIDWTGKLDNELLGVPEETLDSVVHRVVKNLNKK